MSEKKFKIVGHNFGKKGEIIGKSELTFSQQSKMRAMGERWASLGVVVEYFNKNDKGQWEEVFFIN